MKNQTKPNNQLPFLPLNNTLLLEEIKSAEKIGNIYIPDRVRIPVNQGWIVAVGCDVQVDLLKVGFIVVFPLHVEHRMEVDNHHYIIINASDVLLSDNGYFASLQKQKELEESNGKETTKKS